MQGIVYTQKSCGGGKKREEETSQRKPLPKGVLEPPLHLVHFLPLGLSTALWPLLNKDLVWAPKPQNCPKWLGEGAKGLLASWRNGLPRVSCTNATLFCTSATLFCTSHTHTPMDLLHPPSPSHFGQFWGFGAL